MTENFDINKHGRVIFEVNEAPQPTDLELRIRREVMEGIEELLDTAYGKTLITCEHQLAVITKIKDRLNLLWGE